jgi:type III secretory pathway component EscU
MVEFIGALLGTFVISRIFWFLTRSWPNSLSKAVALNIICAAFVMSLDFIVWGNSSHLIVYVVCQAIVLFYDLLWLRRTKAPA